MKITVAGGKCNGRFAKGVICEMWRYLGGLPGGGRSPVGANVQQFLPTFTSPEMKCCPPRLHNFHWLFLPLSVLWSEQHLTTSATLAFCGFFLGKSTSSANGCYGMSSQAFFSFGPLPSRMKPHLQTAPAPHCCQVSSYHRMNVQAEAIRENQDLSFSGAIAQTFEGISVN